MDIQELQKNWDTFGKTDPLWAVLSYSGKIGNKWEPEEFFATGAQDVATAFQQVETAGLTIKRGRALDFGCAVGRLTQALASRFESVVGVDIAPSMIELARQFNKYGERCEYVVNEADDLLRFPDASFDFILTLITLQHMEPRYAKNYLAEFLRLLSAEGILLFQLPGTQRETYRRRRELKRFFPPLVRRYYRHLRYGAPLDEDLRPGGLPTMEMYGIPRDELIAFLEAHGGNVIAATEDQAAGDWISYRYIVTRR